MGVIALRVLTGSFYFHTVAAVSNSTTPNEVLDAIVRLIMTPADIACPNSDPLADRLVHLTAKISREAGICTNSVEVLLVHLADRWVCLGCS